MRNVTKIDITVKPSSIAIAEHYEWGAGCKAWHLLKSADFDVKQERMPPGTAGPLHSHRFAHEFFFVLAGGLSIEVGGRRYSVTQSEGMDVPARTPHRLCNDSGQDVEFIAISCQGSYGRLATRLYHLLGRAFGRFRKAGAG
jgi:mannose-6-phosphate isomerase-like protein (cupin superfamily)